MADGGAGPLVLQWAQEHGEVGGVLTSHRQLTAQLQAQGATVRYVDTGSWRRAAAQVPRLWARRSLHLFHITRLWRAVVLSPVFAVLPGRTVVVLHSGSVGRQVRSLSWWRLRLLGLALHAFDEIWAVNDEIRSELPPGLRARVRVVAPFSAAATDQPPTSSRVPHLVSVATNAGLAHYNAELAVETVALLRSQWPDARLLILAYGHDGPELARLRETVADLPWVELSFDAGPDDVHRVLAESEVFLRPTAWDGDSVVVREAMAAGARVVATDTAPRPAGVELAPADPRALADAVLVGGRLSDGSGLAALSMVEAAQAALAAGTA